MDVPQLTNGRSAISVRRATAVDIPTIARIRSENHEPGILTSSGTKATAALLRAFIQDPASNLVVAVAGEAVLGFALATDRAVEVQRRLITRSGQVWRGVVMMVLRDPRRLRLVVDRALRLVRPIRHRSDGEPEPALRLLDIYVAPEARGRGVGRLLLDRILTDAGAAGHAEIGLSVLSDNRAAIKLYRAADFQVDRQGRRSDGRAYITMCRRLGKGTA